MAAVTSQGERHLRGDHLLVLLQRDDDRDGVSQRVFFRVCRVHAKIGGAQMAERSFFSAGLAPEKSEVPDSVLPAEEREVSRTLVVLSCPGDCTQAAALA